MAEHPVAFAPFEDSLDRDISLKLLGDVASGSDDCELFLERARSEQLVIDDQRLKNASYNERTGFGLRAVVGEVAGYAHSSVIDRTALGDAADTVRYAVRNGGGTLSTGPDAAKNSHYRPLDPSSDSTFPDRIELLREIDSYLRSSDNRVVQATASLATSLQEVIILRPDGTLLSDTRPMSRLGLSVILEESGRRESGSTGGGGRHGPGRLTRTGQWQAMADEALRIARVGLAAEPAPAGEMDVALGPGWPGILLHEAIGHGLEGDFNRKRSSAFSGLLGKRVAAPGVTVLDDGTIPDSRGSVTIDDEGTPGQKTTLIEDGILVRYMQDRQNARLMNSAPTGNGRRESYAHCPMPRMTNTYMLGGDGEPDDIVAGMKDGIHAVGFGGGQVDITNGKFVFSCTEAYRVRNGKIGAPLKGATLIGDGASALQKIRATGNDMRLDPGIGSCGKNGQWVPVGVGLPTVLIGGLTVGGAGT